VDVNLITSEQKLKGDQSSKLVQAVQTEYDLFNEYRSRKDN